TAQTRAALKQMLAGKGMILPQLVAFYEARDYEPVWTSDASEMAGEVRTVLSHADEQGLLPDDYKLPPPARPAPGDKAAQYDIALTGALIRYARDERGGRLQPNNVYSDIKLPARSYDPIPDLAKALKSHSLKDFFDGLTPPHP